ncbi:MAG: 50S ribosomal protein L17 [Calditrichaeota bacterium]|nr:MAG: 50S ribosomal protein L17 [Calditrichota bacterium]MBL1204997.1 50S ribosomal protein L17 [Calditrichota bacterium]NOG44827.1 50S ribosomal protein L17 [Calditrichota bacterium]
MRHNKKGTHLGRTTSHKKAMMRNMVASLFEHKSIKTTDAKAKETRRYAEKLITYAKKGSLHHRRLAFKFLQNKEAVKTLFDEIGPACAERQGGYTRIIKLGFRQGDAASISMLELVDFSTYSAEKRAKKTEEKAQKKEAAEKEEAAAAE